jgi:hypothetical protein
MSTYSDYISALTPHDLVNYDNDDDLFDDDYGQASDFFCSNSSDY